MITIRVRMCPDNRRDFYMVFADERFLKSFWDLRQAVAYAKGLEPLGWKLVTAQIIPLRREVSA